MAERTKRAKLRGRISAPRARTLETSKSAQRGGTKRSKRAVKEASQKKRQRVKSPRREVETVVVDVEEPTPGVITVTEFEETQIPGRAWVETKGGHET